MTARCIFCREDRTDYSTSEHFIPERFGHGHPFVLEADQEAVCDGCQRWGSRQVDRALVQQLEAVAGYLSLFLVPGKTGRPSDIRTPGGLTFEPTRGRLRMAPDRRSETRDARDHTLVARGIYKMALGALAWKSGVDRARASDLDQVAAFVRGKVVAPFRPFARAHGRWVAPDVGMAVRIEPLDGGLRVAVQLHVLTLWAVLVGPIEELLRSVANVPGLLAQWLPGEEMEVLSAPTMLSIAPARDGSLQVAVKPSPDFVGGVITPESMVRSITASPLQLLDVSGPAWRSSDEGKTG